MTTMHNDPPYFAGRTVSQRVFLRNLLRGIRLYGRRSELVRQFILRHPKHEDLALHVILLVDDD